MNDRFNLQADEEADLLSSATPGTGSYDPHRWDKAESNSATVVTKLQKYSPDQDRDERGRWTSGGGGATEEKETGKNASELYAKYADPTVTADQIIDKVPGSREALATAQAKLSTGTETKNQFMVDGKYTAEREAVHQQIISNYLNKENVEACRPAAGEKPTMTILGGRGGSGKSWLTSEDGPVKGNGINEDNHRVGNALYLNSDDIKGMLPEYQGWNAPLLHEEATDVFDKIDSMARGLGMNVVHDSTMKTASTAMDRLQGYRDAGYNVEGHYMFAPPQLAATQALGRFTRGTDKLSDEAKAAGATGRLVSPKYILGSTTNEASFDSAKNAGMFDKWSVWKAGSMSGKRTPDLYASSDGF